MTRWNSVILLIGRRQNDEFIERRSRYDKLVKLLILRLKNRVSSEYLNQPETITDAYTNMSGHLGRRRLAKEYKDVRCPEDSFTPHRA